MRKCLWVVLILAVLTGCLKQELQTGLSEQEAQEIIVLLKEHGLDAAREREVGGEQKEGPLWTVKVKGGDQNLVLAWRILQENGLPREKVKGLSEAFPGGGMIPTAGEEKARLIVGLSGEISRTLKSVAGVVDARVHVVLPENSPLMDREDRKPTTASVLVKYQGSQLPLKEEEIRSLVARGVEGLQPENVAVVYKKIEPKTVPPRDVSWYLGNQEVTVVSLALAVIAGLGCIGLALRANRLRAKVGRLENELTTMAQRRQLPAESVAEGAGRR